MRIALSLLLALGVFGCSNEPKVDDTPNQVSPNNDYPPGPYGYVEGSVMENVNFVGKLDPQGPVAGASEYDALPMANLALAELRRDPAVRFIVLSGVARWCGPCNAEQKSVRAAAAQFHDAGFRFLEALIEGNKRGVPATETDLNAWAKTHKLHVGIGLDPEDKIHQYADIAAFPLNMVVRTSDMQIVHMHVGQEELDPVLSKLQ
jgi:hypothetical protein